MVADCIYTHSQLTDQEKVGFTRTFLDIESINSLDIENLNSCSRVFTRQLG